MGNCLRVVNQVVEVVNEVVEHLEEQQQELPHVDDKSLFHETLPNGAEKAKVRNVYDGDTLTLTDERRVRFLMIDTPEIKERQPYAQEAKAYTKSLCDKTGIWLVYGDEKKDHYGRLLAFIYVKTDDGYLCVNEGIVAAGLAVVYTPRKDKKAANFDKMLALQRTARGEKRGLWADFNDEIVFHTTNGSAYHHKGCKYISKSKKLVRLKASQAQDKGLHPCRTCFA